MYVISAIARFLRIYSDFIWRDRNMIVSRGRRNILEKKKQRMEYLKRKAIVDR